MNGSDNVTYITSTDGVHWTSSTDLEKPGDEFRKAVKDVLTPVREEHRKRLGVHGKYYGQWRIWQEEKLYNLEEIPKNRYERFSQFIAETSLAIQNGKYHIHAFYNSRESLTYWKVVSRPSIVCKYPGRCKKVSITIALPDQGH